MFWPTTLLQYQWSILDADSANGPLPVVRHTSPKWFYTFEECERDADKYCLLEEIELEVSYLQSMTVRIISRRVRAASAKEVSANLALYLMRREIQDLMIKNCYGCAIDDPSQVAHMERGCLMNWEEAVDIYMQLSLMRLTPARMEPYICRICQVMHVSRDQLTVDLYNPSNIENLIIAADADKDYDLLFDLP